MKENATQKNPLAAADRREFVKFMLASPIAAAVLKSHPSLAQDLSVLDKAASARNVFQMHDAAKAKLSAATYDFITGGSDDMKTVAANRAAFDKVQIRARRLVDVSNINTELNLFGETLPSPIMLAPVGAQQRLNPEGELAMARAAGRRGNVLFASTMTNYDVEEISEAYGAPVWFQLYASPDRDLVKHLLGRAAAAGSKVIALTVDSPTLGNRERQVPLAAQNNSGTRFRLGNFEDYQGPPRIGDPSLTWDFIAWLRDNTDAKLVLKGIVTREDAKLCLKYGVDGLVISNHGGRQEESNRGTLEALPEIADEIRKKIPILIDGGFRRGTDIFKALALGADAICIGRPYLWGNAAFGEDGVRKVLDILQAELVRIMKLSGTPTLDQITDKYVVSDL